MNFGEFLQGPDGGDSSSRLVLVVGVAGVTAFFLFVSTGIAMNIWEWEKWEGPMEWIKWLLLSVVVPYAVNRFRERSDWGSEESEWEAPVEREGKFGSI